MTGAGYPLLFNLLPICIIIAAGALARRLLFPDDVVWKSLDRINFRILIPCLIVSILAGTDLRQIPSLAILVTVTASLLFIFGLLFLFYLAFIPRRMDAAAYSSLFQTSTRWNAAIALVVVGLVYQGSAMSLIALVMVALMPLVNVVNISMMVGLFGGDRPGPAGFAAAVLKNPVILGCLVGLGLSLSGLGLWPPLSKALETLGHASIGAILLSIGASLTLVTVVRRFDAIALSCVLKLFLMPLAVVVIGSWLGLAAEILAVLAVAVAAPTAMHGYVVAREMGGDAPLYASIGTAQTLLALLTIPAWVVIAPALTAYLRA